MKKNSNDNKSNNKNIWTEMAVARKYSKKGKGIAPLWDII